MCSEILKMRIGVCLVEEVYDQSVKSCKEKVKMRDIGKYKEREVDIKTIESI